MLQQNISLNTLPSRPMIRFSGPYLRQQWSIPDSILYYITFNPSTASFYQKIVQTCKYFYTKNPIFVIDDLYYRENKWQMALNRTYTDLDINACKYWITTSFDIGSFGHSEQKNLASTIIPRLQKCDAGELNLTDQVISFNEYLFIASNIQILYFEHVVVKNTDGTIVLMEDLLKSLPKVKCFNYECTKSISTITSETVKKLINILPFTKLEYFTLHQIPEAFDINAFYAYLKENRSIKFQLYFCDSISEAYINRLQSIVDEILETKDHDYHPPCIGFSGLAEEKFYKLQHAWDNWAT